MKRIAKTFALAVFLVCIGIPVAFRIAAALREGIVSGKLIGRT